MDGNNYVSADQIDSMDTLDIPFPDPTATMRMVYPIGLGVGFVRMCNILQEELVDCGGMEMREYEQIVDPYPFTIVGAGGTRIVCRYTGDDVASGSYVVKFTLGNEHTSQRPQLTKEPATFTGEYQSNGERLLNSYLRHQAVPEQQYFAPLVVPIGVQEESPAYSWVMMKEYTQFIDVYTYSGRDQFADSLLPLVQKYRLDLGVENIGVDLSWSETYSVANPPEQGTDAFYRSLVLLDYGLYDPEIVME